MIIATDAIRCLAKLRGANNPSIQVVFVVAFESIIIQCLQYQCQCQNHDNVCNVIMTVFEHKYARILVDLQA